MLEDNLAICFADKEKVIPNMEVKSVHDNLDDYSLKNKIKVVMNEGYLWTSKISLQIAYKRYVLKSSKYFEDALHLQKIFKIKEDEIN